MILRLYYNFSTADLFPLWGSSTSLGYRVGYNLGYIFTVPHATLPMAYPWQEEDNWVPISSISDEYSDQYNARRNCFSLFLDKNKRGCSAWGVNSVLSIHVRLTESSSKRTEKLLGEKATSCWIPNIQRQRKAPGCSIQPWLWCICKVSAK